MAFTVLALVITAVITLVRLDRRPTLLDALGAVGPLVPLAVLANLVAWTPSPGTPLRSATPTQDAVVVAGLAVSAWSLTRDAGRLRTAWTWAGAITIVTLCIVARLYVGWSSVSAAAVSVVVGGLWAGAVVVIIRKSGSVHDGAAASGCDQPARRPVEQERSCPVAVDSAARSSGSSATLGRWST